MGNPVSNPGNLVFQVAKGIGFVLVCVFVMNAGLSLINGPNDVEFYLGIALTLTPLGLLSYAALRFYNQLVGNAPTEDK